ncbi:MAG: 1-acyl-sn-glycerol-3-phosphate acyltransferase [Alphaproteobacteria bacterium]|nr:1-acyl-sn-glycerol-3-phosphate acyltransferase [Alphaproteobacteria bacterium]
MTKRYWLRSTIYNITFYLLTVLACIVALPMLFLPRIWFLWVVRTWLALNTALERIIMGLSYEVRGLENLPEDGSFIVAAKHQSAYETLKLHVLFEDPAVVLKKELLSIPLWGGFLKKSDVIAIDRSSREQAMNSIIEGAKRMSEQGRPIIIFPQGTRVGIDESTKDKPYKFGIARLYEATKLPVIPMALNTGYFHPRKGWLKRPGKVMFEFLPAMEPDLKREEFMRKLESALEEKSIELLQDARYAEKEPNKLLRIVFGIIFLGILAAGYSFLWFKTADFIKQQFNALHFSNAERAITGNLYIKGFPGPMQIVGGDEFIESREGRIKIDGFLIEGFPLPFAPLRLETRKITVSHFRYPEPFIIDSAVLDFSITGLNTIHISDGLITSGEFSATPEGTVIIPQNAPPDITLNVALQNHPALVQTLIEKNMVDQRSALFISAGLSAFMRDGVVNVPVTVKEGTVYAGPFAIAKLPGISPDRFLPAPVTDTPPAPSP